MAAEEILKLFYSFWFERELFTKKPVPSPLETNPVLETHEEYEEPKLPRVLTMHVRSMSDRFLSTGSSFTSDSLSPNSVLGSPKLQTILSGKEAGDGELVAPVVKNEDLEITKKKKVSRMRRRRKGGSCKSLSGLEFQELKGFMDLGFVFSEEDKDSNLVSIIPGLQRLGREDEKDEAIDESEVSRPYLSEAWDVLELRKEEKKPLMNWRIPALGNEVDMKDHLRFWAHTVASSVR